MWGDRSADEKVGEAIGKQGTKVKQVKKNAKKVHSRPTGITRGRFVKEGNRKEKTRVAGGHSNEVPGRKSPDTMFFVKILREKSHRSRDMNNTQGRGGERDFSATGGQKSHGKNGLARKGHGTWLMRDGIEEKPERTVGRQANYIAYGLTVGDRVLSGREQ